MPSLNVASLLPCLSRLSLRAPNIGSDAAESKAQSSAAVDAVPELVKKCVGFLAVSRFTRGDVNGPLVIFIEELFVHEDVRGRGLAGCLLKGAIGTEEYGDASTASLVVRSNATQQEYARRLYGNLDFLPLPAPPRKPPGNLTEPAWLDPLGERTAVNLTPKPARKNTPSDQVEQYMEVQIKDLRSNLESACERAEEWGLNPTTDEEAQDADVFIEGHLDLMEEARLHHDAPGGDGGDVEALLRAANWGVYAVYVRVAPPRSRAKRALFDGE